jgi:hypothetical protein
MRGAGFRCDITSQARSIEVKIYGRADGVALEAGMGLRHDAVPDPARRNNAAGRRDHIRQQPIALALISRSALTSTALT